jgi:uncharacterized protein HemY
LHLEDREAKREQREVERLFAESARTADFKRRQQHAREWAAFHERQGRSLESTLGDLVTYHSREENRYRQLLNGIPTTEGES